MKGIRCFPGLPGAGRLLGVLLAYFLAGCRDAPGDDSPLLFRVMTYNIHHGEGLDGRIDLPRVAELIKRERADIVALQEVDKGVQRTARRDLPAELARLTGMTCVFSNNFHYQGGEYGNAVLTRFPIKSSTNTHYKMLRPGEQRGVLQLVLNVLSRELVFLDTHVDYRRDDAERLASVSEVQALVGQYRGRPMILCGDFNDTPDSRTHRKLADEFIDTWTLIGTGEGLTIPADKPARRIDYIWVSKDSPLLPLRIWVPPSAASDHLPVMAEFRFK
jgi:endonuclease/exonuclease/phosphatase family metal-dependent hydrolase